MYKGATLSSQPFFPQHAEPHPVNKQNGRKFKLDVKVLKMVASIPVCKAMAVEARPELVGKRFLCVSGEEPLELGEIGRWGWRAGVIRAVSHRDYDNPELAVRTGENTVTSLRRVLSG
ncbi:JHD2C protein, partial [Polypterus senegalus]|nr:JHD2C protein [Polypterus senegalus]